MQKTALLLALLGTLLMFGCKSSQLEQGGAYAPAVTSISTNAGGEITTNTVLTARPEREFYVADAAYKLAYDTVDGVLKFERDNRSAVAAISPQIKPALDKIRPIAWNIDQRMALARKAYKANPTPAGLTTIQSILSEIQRLVPVVQTQISPVYAQLTKQP